MDTQIKPRHHLCTYFIQTGDESFIDVRSSLLPYKTIYTSNYTIITVYTIIDTYTR